MTFDHKLLASVFEIMGRAVSEDLVAATPEEADRGYVARLEALSRLTSGFTFYLIAAHAEGDLQRIYGLVENALDAISTATDAEFWLAIADASEDDLIRIAFALEGRKASVSTSKPSCLDVAHHFLAGPDVRDAVTQTTPS